MPIDELAGEVVGAAVEFVGDSVVSVFDEPPKRNRFLRFLYWLVFAMFLGGILFVVGYIILN